MFETPEVLSVKGEKDMGKLAVIKKEIEEGEEVVSYEVKDLVRQPVDVLQDAQRAAQALKDVISKKTKKVEFNGEQYLEFEDWQTIGKFYGVSAKVEFSRYVEYGTVKGFEARAVVVQVSTGQEISAADAMCLNDERNWKDKPLFQLKSMAQTRACAKSLRNVLAWVAVLAGYKPTPAEEMQEDGPKQQVQTNAPAPPNVKPPKGWALIEDKSLPYWTTEHKGKFYIFAKIGEYFDKDFLWALGFTQTKANKDNYFRQFDELFLLKLEQEFKKNFGAVLEGESA